MTKRINFAGLVIDLELPSNVDSEIDAGRWFDPDVAGWIRQFAKPGMCCIDAGANWGIFTLLMAQCVGPEGQVWAFEPASRFYARCQTHMQMNNFNYVNVIHAALSDIKGEAVCSVDGPPLYSTAHIDYTHSEIQCKTDEYTRLFRLDDFWNMNSIQGRLGFMKIDVDGSEERLIKGATNIIATFRPIIAVEIEVSEMGKRAMQLLEGQRYDFQAASIGAVDVSYPIQMQGKGCGTVNILATPR